MTSAPHHIDTCAPARVVVALRRHTRAHRRRSLVHGRLPALTFHVPAGHATQECESGSTVYPARYPASHTHALLRPRHTVVAPAVAVVARVAARVPGAVMLAPDAPHPALARARPVGVTARRPGRRRAQRRHVALVAEGADGPAGVARARRPPVTAALAVSTAPHLVHALVAGGTAQERRAGARAVVTGAGHLVEPRGHRAHDPAIALVARCLPRDTRPRSPPAVELAANVVGRHGCGGRHVLPALCVRVASPHVVRRRCCSRARCCVHS